MPHPGHTQLGPPDGMGMGTWAQPVLVPCPGGKGRQRNPQIMEF